MDKIPIESIPCDERIRRLSTLLQKEFDCKPTFIVRVPGRVNIIGEHIDYCGYPVLPMAIQQDILVAAAITEEPVLRLRNVNSKYCNFDTKIENYDEIKIIPDSNGKPYWYNYILCGIKGTMEYLKGKTCKGLLLTIDGNIPPASGLSSSSALVSAACLCYLFSNSKHLSKTEIASLCASSERYIGTQGGGMDQAIAFLAQKNCAQYITWQPLKATAVKLPEDAAFVVAHSLAEANKAATNDFNVRVIECRLAAKILVNLSDINTGKKVITLSEVQKHVDKDLTHMVKLVKKLLPKDIYSKEEICDILKITSAEMNEIYLTENTKDIKEFKLQQRALHVYEEAMRVDLFKNACQKAISNRRQNIEISLSNNVNRDSICNDYLITLGKLMSDSHTSLKSLYECSHKNLDCLVELSKKNNVHARLTGAGWGGCIVALCPKNKTNEYMKILKEKFYIEQCKLSENEANSYVFATIPSHGAVIYKDC